MWLVHYTTLDALMGIVGAKTSGFQMFLAKELEDAREGRVTKEDWGIEDALAGSDGAKWCAQRYQDAAICCFVASPRMEVRDELLFWKLYGDNGQGVSITVAPTVVKKWLDTRFVEAVEYRRLDAGPTQDAIEAVSGVIRKLDNIHNDKELTPRERSVVKRAADNFFKQRMLVKGEGYAHEREMRVVRWKADINGERQRDRYRARGGVIKTGWQIPPLRTTKLLTSGTTIVLGPGIRDHNATGDTIRRMLNRTFGSDVVLPTIEPSRVQMRQYLKSTSN